MKIGRHRYNWSLKRESPYNFGMVVHRTSMHKNFENLSNKT